MTDPYRVLNVPRSADQATIKQAYRKLAKTLHPDRNPGNAPAEQRFKEVSQAYDLLSDPAKRALFDRGEIDAEGRRRRDFGFDGFGGYAGARDAAAREAAARGAAESLFEKMFGGGFGGSFGRGFAGGAAGAGRFRAQAGQSTAGAAFEETLRGQTRGAGGAAGPKLRGADRRYRLGIDLRCAARGGRQRLQLDDGRTIEVDVPAGTESGKVLRLKGQGEASPLGGRAGDALVQIEVRPDPEFRRQGQDIYVDAPISLPEAVLGARITVPTLDGPVRLTVPPGSSGGRSLRLKGKGIALPGAGYGDQYVRLLVVLPDAPDAELEDWARRHADEVRPGGRKD
jgi:DnaJ-class molecular chaperone